MPIPSTRGVGQSGRRDEEHGLPLLEISGSREEMTAQRSSLITYLNDNGCIVRPRTPSGGEERELTHTLMNGASGGRIAIRESAADGFFAAYGEDLARGHKLFVIERRSEVFNMHLDCDFKTIPSDHSLRTFASAVHRAVAAYFGGGSPRAAGCIICAVLNEDGVSRKAPGLHIMFPFAPVDETAALWIRAGVVHALAGLRGFENEDWATVIDICVLTTAGLRMVGSDKCKTCPACHNSAENRPFCELCGHVGKVAEEKIYWPHLAWPEDDSELQDCLAEAKANPAHAARLCSTRKPAGTRVCENFSIPPGAPPCATKKRVRASPGETSDRVYVLGDDGPDLPKAKKSKVLQLEVKEAGLLLKALRAYHPAYGDIEIKEVREWKNGKSSTAVVKVAGFGSRHCLNKGSDHASQSIYFVVTPQGGLAQRCFSRKETQRKCGLCGSFSSTSKPITAELRAALFSDAGANVGGQRVPEAPHKDPTELQRSAARTAGLLAQLPARLVRSRTSVAPQSLAALEIPHLCA